MIPLVLFEVKPDLSRHYPDSSQLAELTVQIAYSIKSFKITDMDASPMAKIFFIISFVKECRKAEEYGLKIVWNHSITYGSQIPTSSDIRSHLKFLYTILT